MAHNLQKNIIAIILFIAIVLGLPVLGVPNYGNIAIASPQLFLISPLALTNQPNPDQLTPQVKQELQAVHQRRNRDIIQVLDQSQRAELDHYVRSGENIESAVNNLNLDRNQWDTIQAVIELSRLKTKAILARHHVL